jgi:outer membrane protein
MRYLFFSFILLLSISLSAQQKYGHLNTGNILESLPAVSIADSTLSVYQKDFKIKEDEMIAEFEKEYLEFVKKANAGELPKVVIEKKQLEFQQKEQTVIDYQKEVQQKMAEKRRELLDPILKNLQEAVNRIARDNGYTYIFDISTGAFLFASESEDIEPLVRIQLGI